MKHFLLILLIVLSISSVKAGDRVGNGGDVIVCSDSVELLDLYEARVKGYKINPPANNSDNREMLETFLKNKVRKIQPIRAERYLNHAKSFTEEADFRPGIELPDVDDAGLAVIPKGCKLEQIVIQLSDQEILPGDKRYIVSLDLWNKLDEFNKMSLVLHEIIYREQIEKKNSNSMVVRAFVGQLLAENYNLEIMLKLNLLLTNTIEFFQWNIKQVCESPGKSCDPTGCHDHPGSCKKIMISSLVNSSQEKTIMFSIEPQTNETNFFTIGRQYFVRLNVRVSDGRPEDFVLLSNYQAYHRFDGQKDETIQLDDKNKFTFNQQGTIEIDPIRNSYNINVENFTITNQHDFVFQQAKDVVYDNYFRGHYLISTQDSILNCLTFLCSISFQDNSYRNYNNENNTFLFKKTNISTNCEYGDFEAQRFSYCSDVFLTGISINILQKKIPITLKGQMSSLYLNADVIAAGTSPFEAKIDNKFYIGKMTVKRKTIDMYLDPGVYTFEFYNHSNYISRIKGAKITYQLNEDGTVTTI